MNPTYRPYAPARLLLALLLVGSFAYLGMLIAATVHEVVGHGLATLLVGGQFLGFQLDLDGMGHAWTPLPQHAGRWHQVVVFLGGVTATTAVGSLLLATAYAARKKPVVALPALALALNLLLEGSPYLFWNALHPVLPGDVAVVVAIYPLPWVRTLLMAMGGGIMIASIMCGAALLLWMIEGWVGNGQPLTGRWRIIALVLLGALSGAAWFLFDWNQLAPGLDSWPNVVGLSLHLAAALSLFWIRIAPEPLAFSRRATAYAVAVGWAMVATAVAVTVFWLRPGWVWGA
ncbi:MAG: M50 family metallopeptidase [Planctomycetes bacterium]|nr:M50 family metallopeptidase [Planctomycetota bacterium]